MKRIEQRFLYESQDVVTEQKKNFLLSLLTGQTYDAFTNVHDVAINKSTMVDQTVDQLQKAGRNLPPYMVRFFTKQKEIK
jgi:hypothetical protein